MWMSSNMVVAFFALASIPWAWEVGKPLLISSANMIPSVSPTTVHNTHNQNHYNKPKMTHSLEHSLPGVKTYQSPTLTERGQLYVCQCSVTVLPQVMSEIYQSPILTERGQLYVCQCSMRVLPQVMSEILPVFYTTWEGQLSTGTIHCMQCHTASIFAVKPWSLVGDGGVLPVP